jgi:hypothetical protein
VPHLKSQSEAKNVHGGEGGVGGVGVSQLEDLDEDQHHHDVHHRGVKLETDIGGTNMEDHTEEPLHMKILISYLWTYDLYGPVRNASDAGKYITWASGRGFGPGNQIFGAP